VKLGAGGELSILAMFIKELLGREEVLGLGEGVSLRAGIGFWVEMGCGIRSKWVEG
jgi:hypothetical protein